MSRRRTIDRFAGAALVLAGCASGTPARADSLTAGLLYDQCRSMTRPDANDSGRLICTSYIRGTVDTIRVRAFETTGSAEAQAKAMPFCFPEGLDMAAAAVAFIRHVEPGRAAWPCTR